MMNSVVSQKDFNFWIELSPENSQKKLTKIQHSYLKEFS